MKKTLIPVIFIFGMFLALCSGCAHTSDPVRSEFFCMDTVIQFILYPENGGKKATEQAHDALSSAETEAYRIDALLTDVMGSMKDTDPSAADKSYAEDPKILSDEALSSLLDRALSVSENTQGAFDPTIYPVVRAWGFYSGEYRIPSDDELRTLLDASGWEKARGALDSSDASALPVLDLGGIGKGYAASVLKAHLNDCGVSSAIISLGGNVSLLGSKPDGSDFTVGIQDPEDKSVYYATVTLSDTAVVTSGSYERYFEKDGVTYSHIIDPDTGRPVDNSLLSVTIVTEDDVLADALSTALFVMGKDGAVRFYQSGIYDFDMILMEKDRSITISEGLESVFNTTEAAPAVVRK